MSGPRYPVSPVPRVPARPSIPYAASLVRSRSPRRGFNDPLGHKLPRRNVAGTKGEASLFVRQSYEPGGVRIE